MNPTRRSVLTQMLCGAGLLGLRSLASGIPAAILLDPRRASADTDAGATGFTNPQFLVYSTSSSGDPLNCNAPGTYLDPKISHPSDPRMAMTNVTIGGATYGAAAPWATLGAIAKAPGLFSRMALIHHSTGTVQHTSQPDVQALSHDVLANDMAVSAFAAALAPVLGTIQAQPVTIGTAGSLEAISFAGRPQPLLNPMALSTVLGSPTGVLGSLQSMRDRDLNRLSAFFKARGTSSQGRFLDTYATSQTQVRQLSTTLLTQLAAIKDNSADSQVKAAIILIQMKVAPIVTIHVPFGGDNHFDGNLGQEASETVSGMATLAGLFSGLADAGLSDSVTFASLNVFGRTLVANGGRNHNGDHHVTVLAGKNVKGVVAGGVAPNATDYGAMPIDSKTGATGASADIRVPDTLASTGKTLGAALGIPAATVNGLVVAPSTGAPVGKIITAAIAT